MREIGKQLIAEKKQAILANQKDGVVEKKSLQGKDILSLLIRANMATDLPETSRMDEEDVLARMSPFT